MKKIGAVILAAAALSASACGGGSERYDARGEIVSVNADGRVIKIAHGDIPGFMPAMTMSFDVAPGVGMAGVAPGEEIAFTIERTSRSLRIVRLERIGAAGTSSVPLEEASREAGEDPLGPRAAPDIRLIDQEGRAFDLERFRGRAVLLDFIFTTCNGPCPILTAAHVRLQKRLPEDLRRRVHFVSVTVDPQNDTPEKLERYARAQGAELENWSFLTGDAEAVQAVLSAYHVGSVRLPDGTLNHTVVTYVIDPEGNIRRHYLGLEHTGDEVMADLLKVLS